VWSVYRAERRKLAAQLSTRLLALVCLLAPFAFAVILKLQSGVPSDTLLGVWVHTSGFAVSLVVLGFAGSWGFPVLAGVLAGDVFSSEDRYGTWKMVLTRSCIRRDLFAGKVLAAATFSVALVLTAALSSLVAGLLVTGDQPLVGLGGTVLGSGKCLGLVLASWLVSVLPLLAFTSLALLISVLTRNGIAGVLAPVIVGLVMALLALIGSGSWMHVLLVRGVRRLARVARRPCVLRPADPREHRQRRMDSGMPDRLMVDLPPPRLRRSAGWPEARVGCRGPGKWLARRR